MKEETLSNVAAFLAQGAKDLKLLQILIAFHGGEPLLVKPERLRRYCEIFLKELHGFEVGFQLQTNGVLVNDEWVKLFTEYKINVGISLDGDAPSNDKFRISNSGQGTYESTVSGLKALRNGFPSDLAYLQAGTISVINPYFDYKKLFKHIHIDLGVNELSFLLPDCQHDTGLPYGSTPEHYGKVLCDIFDAWIETGMVAKVRQLSALLNNLQAVRSSSNGVQESEYTKETQIIVIQSDGDISIDDTYMVALEWRQSQATPNVNDETLKDYLERPIISEIDNLKRTLPTGCRTCTWSNLCRGGDIENRYAKSNGFDNPSIFCEGLKIFYSHVINYLIENGYPKDRIEQYLLSEERRKWLFTNALEPA